MEKLVPILEKMTTRSRHALIEHMRQTKPNFNLTRKQAEKLGELAGLTYDVKVSGGKKRGYWN